MKKKKPQGNNRWAKQKRSRSKSRSNPSSQKSNRSRSGSQGSRSRPPPSSGKTIVIVRKKSHKRSRRSSSRGRRSSNVLRRRKTRNRTSRSRSRNRSQLSSRSAGRSMKDTIRKRKAKAKGKHAKAKSVPEQPVFKMWQLEVLEKGLLALAILVTLAFLAAACYVIGGVFVDIKHEELEYRCKNSTGSESDEQFSSSTPAGFSTLWPQTGTTPRTPNVSASSEETRSTETLPPPSPSQSTPSSTSTDTQSTSSRKTTAKPTTEKTTTDKATTEKATTEKMTTEKTTTVTTAAIPDWKRRVFCDTTDERPDLEPDPKDANDYWIVQCSNDFNLLHRYKDEKIFYKRNEKRNGKIVAWLHVSNKNLWDTSAECIVCVQSDRVVLSHGLMVTSYIPFDFSSSAIPKPSTGTAKGIWYNRTSVRVLHSLDTWLETNQNETDMMEYVVVDNVKPGSNWDKVRVPRGSFDLQPVYSARLGKWIGLNVRSTYNPHFWLGGSSITQIPIILNPPMMSFNPASITISDNSETLPERIEMVYGIGVLVDSSSTYISSQLASVTQLGSKLIYPCNHNSSSVTMYNGVLYACCSSIKSQSKIQCQSYSTKSKRWENFAAPNSDDHVFHIRALQSKKATPQLIAISTSQTWWFNGVDWYELKQSDDKKGQLVGFDKWDGDLVVGYAG